MKLSVVLLVLALSAVCAAAPMDAPADTADGDLQGAELFFRPRYYRPSRYHNYGYGRGYGYGYGYGRRYGYGGYGSPYDDFGYY
ncbi:prismalin-14-like isoform X1 [Amphibalanus amphitrite]|uniref:prismalin-14-like isoform X1 n=1 Tax=Amphibalanus amphitrite TaxID=1232801 RepID=UPI001C9187BE|nr:prismalin-14-like isoform X1 [Amphibalanus amphitrite]